MPSLARSVPKPLSVPSLARSVHKPLKVPRRTGPLRGPRRAAPLVLTDGWMGDGWMGDGWVMDGWTDGRAGKVEKKSCIFNISQKLFDIFS